MEKNLGVIMDGVLKFHNHVAQAAKKASGALAQIRRTMTYHNEITLLYNLFTPYEHANCHMVSKMQDGYRKN